MSFHNNLANICNINTTKVTTNFLRKLNVISQNGVTPANVKSDLYQRH